MSSKPKNLQIHVRVSQEQKRKFADRARSLGLGVSTWMVVLAMRELKRDPRDFYGE